MKQFFSALFWSVIILGAQSPFAAQPWDSVLTEAVGGTSTAVKFTGTVEAGFAPEGGGEKLVVKVIDSARVEVKVLAYSFTSPDIVAALIAARKRGVDVQVVVDYRNNITEDTHNKARRALALLVGARIPVQTVSAWQTQHSKVIVVDRRHVQTGSFNYSAVAVNRNSDNVLVLWDCPDLAKLYLEHWESRSARGETFAKKN